MARRKCPQCGSYRIATILYGMPAWSPEMEEREEVWLAGCCIPEERMEWHCFHCGKDWA